MNKMTKKNHFEEEKFCTILMLVFESFAGQICIG